ncbi:MAG TPA: hypothetical protein VFI65_10680 [Streptosporangiaceae bacterium]|nr:hypothetical protein [Streptosporangiaceae bacterium]
MTAWIIVFVGVLYELVAGVVTQTASNAVTIPVLALPVVVALTFAAIQVHQVRSSNAERSHWWHLGAIALGLLVWQLWPVTPSALLPVHNARDACVFMFTATPACIAQAKSAYFASSLTWWITGGLILALVPLVRYSKIAAWTALPLAFAGCQLASHFLLLLLHHYHVTGF